MSFSSSSLLSSLHYRFISTVTAVAGYVCSETIITVLKKKKRVKNILKYHKVEQRYDIQKSDDRKCIFSIRRDALLHWEKSLFIVNKSWVGYSDIQRI